MKKGINLIFIMLDSFRQDHVGIYHKGKSPFPHVKPCDTPNLDKFAEECVILENVYPCGLPTIPVRFELMTGYYSLPYRPWAPLTSYDLTIAEILKEYEYVNAFITDTYHYRAPGMNYHRGFHEVRWIQGQEYDAYVSRPLKKKRIEDYVNKYYFNPPGSQKERDWIGRILQFLANTEDFTKEEDWFAYRVMSEAVRWLKENRKYQKIFLWVDSFDPHEPWDPPRRFDNYTDPNYKGPRLIMPMGGWAKDWATEEEINYIRGLYAGEASFVDHCLGMLFKTIEEEGYLEDSIIIVTADHGHPLADHGKFLKSGDRLYRELVKVPFLIHLPRGENKGLRSDAIIQFPDVLPTIFELLGLKNLNIPLGGKSFLPVLKGDSQEHRPAAIMGYYENKCRAIYNKEWSYHIKEEGEELYFLPTDPQEKVNVVEKHPEVTEELKSHFGKIFFSRKPHIPGVEERHKIYQNIQE